MRTLVTRLFQISAFMIFWTATGHAQSASSKYSTAENRPECKIWNPNPQPNETVYWTGKCEAGYAEGKGIVSWGNVVNGRAQISVSDVTLKGGKQIGYGKYYPRKGTPSKRNYVNGSVDTATYIAPDFSSGSAKGDLFAAKFPDGLIKSVNPSDMRTIFEHLGYEVIKSGFLKGNPIVVAKDPNSNNEMMMIGTVCASSSGKCVGIMIAAALESNRSLSFTEVNNFNFRYDMAKLLRRDENPKSMELYHYVILNYGVHPENLRITLKSFSAMVDQVEKDFDANVINYSELQP